MVAAAVTGASINPFPPACNQANTVGNSRIVLTNFQNSLSFTVTFFFVLLHDCPGSDFFGTVTISSRALLDVLVLSLLFASRSRKVLLTWHTLALLSRAADDPPTTYNNGQSDYSQSGVGLKTKLLTLRTIPDTPTGATGYTLHVAWPTVSIRATR